MAENGAMHVLLTTREDTQWVCCACMCAEHSAKYNEHNEHDTLSRSMQFISCVMTQRYMTELAQPPLRPQSARKGPRPPAARRMP